MDVKKIALLTLLSLLLASCKSQAPTSAKQDAARAQSSAPAQSSAATQTGDDQNLTGVHGLMIDDMNGDGRICLPEILQAYVNQVDNSGVTPRKFRDYDLQTWNTEPVKLEPGLVAPDGRNYSDGNGTQHSVYDGTVIVGQMTAFRNILDPDDYAVSMRLGGFVEETFKAAMCAGELKLGKNPSRENDFRRWSAWVTPGGTIYGSLDNRGAYTFYSANYLAKDMPGAYYQWQPLINAVPQ